LSRIRSGTSSVGNTCAIGRVTGDARIAVHDQLSANGRPEPISGNQCSVATHCGKPVNLGAATQSHARPTDETSRLNTDPDHKIQAPYVRSESRTNEQIAVMITVSRIPNVWSSSSSAIRAKNVGNNSAVSRARLTLKRSGSSG